MDKKEIEVLEDLKNIIATRTTRRMFMDSSIDQITPREELLINALSASVVEVLGAELIAVQKRVLSQSQWNKGYPVEQISPVVHS